ncbi:MAG TPA: hypothetical protein VGU44_03180 [Gammaproteobacteria bacterium]|nr:hypothetical protein [Gammaproteobacteria bacterium]
MSVNAGHDELKKLNEDKGESMTEEKAATAAMPTQTSGSVQAPLQAHPIKENSEEFSVISSDIARAQMIYKVTKETGCDMRPTLDKDGKPTGDFGLFKKGSHSTMPAANIQFTQGENAEAATMHATFKKPVDPVALEAMQFSAAWLPPNLLMTNPQYPSEYKCNFEDKGLEKFAKTTFEKNCDTVNKEQDMTLIGAANSRENRIEDAKSVSEQRSSPKKQDETEKLPGGGGLRK